MARSWYSRSNAKAQFIQTPRVRAVARERAWMAAHPYAFGDYDHVAAHLRRRAFNRMHTIVKEQQWLKKNMWHSPRSQLQKSPAWKNHYHFTSSHRPGKRLFIRKKGIQKVWHKAGLYEKEYF
jgi:hypothetical protein